MQHILLSTKVFKFLNTFYVCWKTTCYIVSYRIIISVLLFVHSICYVLDFLLVCNYTLTPTSYRFSSPGYPSSYPHNAYCEYHFKVPEDKAVRIYYQYFSLESSLSCAKDSVKLYENNILKATHCGYKSYLSWNSKESQVLMTFKSDGSSASYGFYGYFSPISKRKSFYHNYDSYTNHVY